MATARRSVQNRAELILAALVALSLLSLVSGTRAEILRDAVRTLVTTTVYPFVVGMNLIERTVDSSFNALLRFEAERTEYAEMKQETAELRIAAGEVLELRRENERLRGLLEFERESPQFELLPAQVLETMRGMITIDRGSIHGIQPAMAVVAPEGVVGVVIEVEPLTSNVATLHHMDARIGAMVERNGLRAYDGVIHASGNDLSRICTMEFIDMQHDVRENDIVVTSPESLFPSGYPIGRITAVHRTATLWRSADVTPMINPYALEEVFILHRAARPAEDYGGDSPAEPQDVGAAEPAAEPQDDAPKNAAPQIPDIRPIQDLYAP